MDRVSGGEGGLGEVERRTHLDGLKSGQDRMRDRGLAERRHPSERGVVLDGHDSRDDGDGHAGRPTALLPPEEDVDVVEELGDDVVGTGLDLGLEKSDVLVFGCRVRVRVGITCHRERTSLSAALLDKRIGNEV